MKTELFDVPKPSRPSQSEIDWIVTLLRGKDWMTAGDILGETNLPDNEANRRRIRLCAQHSAGRIGGGQLGYKLVTEMTAEEFGHFERWMRSQENKMQSRRIEAQRVFYSRTNVAPSAPPPSASGFCLIELLAVVAIVLILAAAAVGPISRAGAAARERIGRLSEGHNDRLECVLFEANSSAEVELQSHLLEYAVTNQISL